MQNCTFFYKNVSFLYLDTKNIKNFCFIYIVSKIAKGNKKIKYFIKILYVHKNKGGLKLSSYIHFTEEERERARNTDLVELLRSQCETLKRSGSEYEWLDGTQKVTIRGNLWFHQYERVGGDAVGFVRKFYNKEYAEAVQFLLDGKCGILL